MADFSSSSNKNISSGFFKNGSGSENKNQNQTIKNIADSQNIVDINEIQLNYISYEKYELVFVRSLIASLHCTSRLSFT